MKILNTRLPQTADRQTAAAEDVWNTLNTLMQILATVGIVSQNGADVDVDGAPCALIPSSGNTNRFDVLPGQVVFPNGAFITLESGDITGYPVPTDAAGAQIVRLQWGVAEGGPLTTNPFYEFAAPPQTATITARDMVRVTSLADYNALSPADLALSVVLGAVSVDTGTLTVDNSRATFSFSRPWATAIDHQHRSYKGSGLVNTTSNPHDTALGDLVTGSSSFFQVAGVTPGVIARPQSFGRIAGSMCEETIFAGNFLVDGSGGVTGVVGALYVALGSWPQTLMRAVLSGTTTEVAAWVPRGRNVLAVYDPVNFTAAADLDVFYARVTAGALPPSMGGTSSITVSQASNEELIVANGAALNALATTSVTFTDVGLIPMAFDLLVDGAAKVYKRPTVLYCNTRLDALGSSAAPTLLQPSQPSRLRVGISNYAPATQNVTLQVTGTDENDSVISEQIAFESPLPVVATSNIEVAGQRQFTALIYKTVSAIQAVLRQGDGPNTTFTLFAELSPERPAHADDCLLATVQWTGSEVSTNYIQDANIAIDRRQVTRGGGYKGLTPVESASLYPLPNNESLAWVTIAEDFADPQWIIYPSADDVFGGAPVELPSNSTGARWGYQSRLIPFTQSLSFTGTSNERAAAFQGRFIPNGSRYTPAQADLRAVVTLYKTDGTTFTTFGLCGNMYPPYILRFNTVPPAGVYYAMSVKIVKNSFSNPAIIDEVIQGFLLHMHQP